MGIRVVFLITWQASLGLVLLVAEQSLTKLRVSLLRLRLAYLYSCCFYWPTQVTRPAKIQEKEKLTPHFGGSCKITLQTTYIQEGGITGAIFGITTSLYSLRNNHCQYFDVHFSRFIQNTYLLFIFILENIYFPESLFSVCFYFCGWKTDVIYIALQFIVFSVTVYLGHISMSIHVSLF